MRDTIEIRNANISDAERLLEIYGYYVRETAVSFEYETPSIGEFRARMEDTMKRYPYLVILEDGVIRGYAYAGPFVRRPAYGWSCEMTIYLDHEVLRRGMGRRLYEALENKLREMGFLNLYACIAWPPADDPRLTTNSADFHAHMGYVRVGEFHNCAYKFGRWYDMIWMEKIIGPHEEHHAPVRTCPEAELFQQEKEEAQEVTDWNGNDEKGM